MNEFKGVRQSFSVSVDGQTITTQTMVFNDGDPIEWRLDEKSHSPTGLEWGYAGSGPSQLAWCLLRECGLTKPQSEKLYMKFKNEVIANLPKDGFVLTQDEIITWISGLGT